MLNILLSALCALSIISSDAPASSDSTVFIIDGKVVEKFDGSQLRNQYIVDYAIEKENGVSIHKITTSSLSINISRSQGIYLNGKQISKEELEKLDKNTIGSIEVIKGSAASSDGTEAEKKGTILIKSRPVISTPANTIYIVDGKQVPAEAIGKIPTASIKNITVLKKESEIRKHTSRKVDMVILVETKK